MEKLEKLEKFQECAITFVNHGLYQYENISKLYAVLNV